MRESRSVVELTAVAGVSWRKKPAPACSPLTQCAAVGLVNRRLLMPSVRVPGASIADPRRPPTTEMRTP